MRRRFGSEIAFKIFAVSMYTRSKSSASFIEYFLFIICRDESFVNIKLKNFYNFSNYSKRIHDMFQRNGLKTQLLAASSKNTQQFLELAEYGIDAAFLFLQMQK